MPPQKLESVVLRLGDELTVIDSRIDVGGLRDVLKGEIVQIQTWEVGEKKRTEILLDTGYRILL